MLIKVDLLRSDDPAAVVFIISQEASCFGSPMATASEVLRRMDSFICSRSTLSSVAGETLFQHLKCGIPFNVFFELVVELLVGPGGRGCAELVLRISLCFIVNATLA